MSESPEPHEEHAPPVDQPGSHGNPAHCNGWAFRAEAAIAVDGVYVHPNLHPVASELAAWLQQMGQVTYFTEETKSKPEAFTNPHTYAASSISRQLMAVVNEAFDVSEREDEATSHDVEVERIRKTSEFTLLAARFVEAATRQLLHCTDFPAKSYKNAALGNLLATKCRVCAGAGRPDRMISLLSSLAHRYGECREFDQCLAPYLRGLNKQRAGEAAHAEAPTILERTAAESRASLADDVRLRGDGFQHALTHLGRVETAMFRDILGSMHRANHQAALNADSKTSLQSVPIPDQPCTGSLANAEDAPDPPVG